LPEAPKGLGWGVGQILIPEVLITALVPETANLSSSETSPAVDENGGETQHCTSSCLCSCSTLFPAIIIPQRLSPAKKKLGQRGKIVWAHRISYYG